MSGYETWESSVSDKHTIEEKVERIFEGLGKQLQNMVGQFLTRVEVLPASFQREHQSENVVLTCSYWKWCRSKSAGHRRHNRPLASTYHQVLLECLTYHWHRGTNKVDELAQ